jgi:hypothetical protein
MYWSHLTQHKWLLCAFVSMVMNLQILENMENFLSIWQANSFSRRIMLHRLNYMATHMWK